MCAAEQYICMKTDHQLYELTIKSTYVSRPFINHKLVSTLANKISFLLKL